MITREPRGEARLVGDEDVVGHVGVLARVQVRVDRAHLGLGLRLGLGLGLGLGSGSGIGIGLAVDRAHDPREGLRVDGLRTVRARVRVWA